MPISYEQADKNFSDYSPAYLAKPDGRTIRLKSLLGLGQDVIPERSVATELRRNIDQADVGRGVLFSRLADLQLVVWYDRHRHLPRHRLAGRQPHTQPAKPVARGE